MEGSSVVIWICGTDRNSLVARAFPSSANGNFMSELNEATIPMNAAPQPRANFTPQPIAGKLINRAMPSILGVSLFLVVLLSAGWVGWRFLRSDSKVDDADSIAEMDGFEQIPSVPSKSANNALPRDRLAVPNPDDSETTANAMLNLPELPKNLFPMAASTPSSEVWLTGTIEETESAEKTELPLRLSGEPNESRIFR